ncbi:MAG: cupin domain-containing protein [Clostridiaceae bacterium]|jgi:quercetin dioxygenase-like cupin family protein|nr:cupin domain-containing protein [Clostridiaceae bacterium]
MSKNFPEPITDLGEVDLPFEGAKAYLSQGDDHQILFMEFDKDIDLPEHSHSAQWAVVLEGRIDMTIGGVRKVYQKGDRYFIPEGVSHYGKIYAGYSDITFFGQSNRYKRK